MYVYRVIDLKRVVDGDTVDLVLDLGFYLTATMRFRLLGVNCPERNETGYRDAANFTFDWITDALDEQSGLLLMASTYKADSFGRWLVNLTTVEKDSGTELETLSAVLIDNGHGRLR